MIQTPLPNTNTKTNKKQQYNHTRLLLPALHKGQLYVKHNRKRYNVLCWGRRAGKTTYGADRVLTTVLSGGHFGWFAPNYKILNPVWDYFKVLLEPVTKPQGKSETGHHIELITGGSLECWSMDAGIVARGRKYKAVAVDEAAFIPHLIKRWEKEISATLVDYSGSADFYSTPDGHNDFEVLFNYAGCDGAGESHKKPDWASFRIPTWENPYLPVEERERVKRLCEVERDPVAKQEYGAEFMDAAGLIYDKWLDDFDGNMSESESESGIKGNVTLDAEYIPDKHLTLFWAVDEGYTGKIDPDTGHYTGESHPRVFLLGQIQPNGRVAIFAENYAIKTLPENHIKEVIAMGYPEPDFAVIDKSAATLKGRLEADGIYCRNGANSVEDSIKLVQSALAADENGFRRLVVHPRCKELRYEMSKYQRKSNEAGGGIIKEFDHGPDSLRYGLHGLKVYGV